MKPEPKQGHIPELPGALFPEIPRVLPEIQHEATGCPLKGSQSVNKSTERTWPWLTDGLSQRHIPVESTIHFTLSTRTPLHTTHTHASPPACITLFFSCSHKYTGRSTGVPGLYHPLYPNKTFHTYTHVYIHSAHHSFL